MLLLNHLKIILLFLRPPNHRPKTLILGDKITPLTDSPLTEDQLAYNERQRNKSLYHSSSSSSSNKSSMGFQGTNDEVTEHNLRNIRTPSSSRSGTPQTNTPIDDAVLQVLQDYSSLIYFPNRKKNGISKVISTILSKVLCLVNVDVGAYIQNMLPCLWGHHGKLEYPDGLITTEDGITYDITPVLAVIVSIQLHLCAREGLDADNVFNRAMNYLITPGFFAKYDTNWSDVSFMTKPLSTAIDKDPNLRVKLSRIAENFKNKLRTKSYPVVQSLKSLRPEFTMPTHEHGIILREVLLYFLLLICLN